MFERIEIGRFDSSGIQIKEGDIVSFKRYGKDCTGVIRWHKDRCGFYVYTQDCTTRDIISRTDTWIYALYVNKYRLSVTGSIYESKNCAWAHKI